MLVLQNSSLEMNGIYRLDMSFQPIAMGIGRKMVAEESIRARQ